MKVRGIYVKFPDIKGNVLIALVKHQRVSSARLIPWRRLSETPILPYI